MRDRPSEQDALEMLGLDPDDAYNSMLYKGNPAVLGLNVRPLTWWERLRRRLFR